MSTVYCEWCGNQRNSSHLQQKSSWTHDISWWYSDGHMMVVGGTVISNSANYTNIRKSSTALTRIQAITKVSVQPRSPFTSPAGIPLHLAAMSQILFSCTSTSFVLPAQKKCSCSLQKSKKKKYVDCAPVINSAPHHKDIWGCEVMTPQGIIKNRWM